MSSKKRKAPAPKDIVQGTRTLGRMIGRPAVFFHCKKAGGIIAAESANERTVAQLAEIDPRVTSIRPQPFTLDILTGALFNSREELEIARRTRVRVEATQRDYTPDFIMQLADGRSMIVEVKDSRYPGDASYLSKIEHAKSILRSRGHGFLTVSFRYDQTTPLVFNAATLSLEKNRIHSAAFSTELAEQVDTLLKDGTASLSSTLQSLGLKLRDAPSLILLGMLSADLSTECLTANTSVAAASGSLGHLELLPFPEVTP